MRQVYGAIAAPPGTIPGRPMPPRRRLVALPGVRYWRTRRLLLQRQLAELARLDIRSRQRIEAGGLAGLEAAARLGGALAVTPEQPMAQPPAGWRTCWRWRR